MEESRRKMAGRNMCRAKIPDDFKEFDTHKAYSQRLNVTTEGFRQDDDVDVVLFQVPLGVDVSNLHGQKIAMEGQSLCKSEDGACSLEIMCVGELPTALKSYLLLVPDTESGRLKPTSATINKCLVMTTRVEQPETAYPEVVDTRVAFPHTLGPRYEPFGAGDPVMTSLPRKHKKAKKRNKDNVDSELESSPSKKRKRAKAEGREEELDQETEPTVVHVKKKKTKKK